MFPQMFKQTKSLYGSLKKIKNDINVTSCMFCDRGLFSLKISLQSVCQEIGTLAAARPVPTLPQKKIYFFKKNIDLSAYSVIFNLF